MSDKSQREMYHRVESAYTNFIAYIHDDIILIDHTYLWDLICKPNPKLFPGGSNLIILEIPEDDITNNVNIICPTNHYSGEMFDINKSSIILIKKNNYYEPIYLFEDTGAEFSVMRRFNKIIARKLPDVIDTLHLIQYSMDNKCKPLQSLPKIYKFKTNVVLKTLLDVLQKYKYIVHTQVMNLSGRIVGVIVSENKTSPKGMIPCFPSSPILDIDYTLDYTSDVLSYEDTKGFLLNAHKKSSGSILSRPRVKIIEDNLIVGILTETNQFIQVTPTQDMYGDDLPKKHSSNAADIDHISLTNDGRDTKRVLFMKNLELESKFFAVFRNTVRILLGKHKYISIRENIEKIQKSTRISYREKLVQITASLKLLMDRYTKFTEYEASILENLPEITNCFQSNKETCAKKLFCFTEANGDCALLIPKKNLIHGGDNEKMYFGRLSDEIIRYTRIQSFIFKPQVFLSFKKQGYNLHKDEIILLQSLLLDDYFDDLVMQTKNPYTLYNTYDTVLPLQSQTYSNEDSLMNYIAQYKLFKEKQEVLVEDRIKCSPPKRTNPTGKWVKILPTGSSELVFNNEPSLCSFDILLVLLKQTNAKYNAFTLENLLEILSLEYGDMSVKEEKKILSIWKSQGKTKMALRVQNKEAAIADIIVGGLYYATNIDLWILARRFNIPLIFYSSTVLVENGKQFIVANTDAGDRDESYYFIKSPAVRIKSIPKYRLLVSKSGNARIPLSSIKEPVRDEMKKMAGSDLFETFLDEFKLEEARARVPKKLVLVKKK